MSRGSLTTLQLARRIATAVLATNRGRMRPRRRHPNSVQDAPTQAVLATLRSTGTWFMEARHDEHGVAIGFTERPLPLTRRRR